MPDRRDHAAVSRPGELDKVAVPVAYLLLDYAAPADAIVVQFAVPFVIGKRNIIGFEGLFRHFKAIADGTSLPIVLYNIPGRCGVDIGPDTVMRLATECRNIVSIKEASGSIERISELRGRLPEAFTILSGDDSLTLPFMSVGAVGVVSVTSNLFPAEVCALVRAFESGDVKSAEKLHRKLFPLFKDLFIEPNPVPVKTALSWRGAMSGECRLPLCEMAAPNQARLRKTLEAFERTR